MTIAYQNYFNSKNVQKPTFKLSFNILIKWINTSHRLVRNYTNG